MLLLKETILGSLCYYLKKQNWYSCVIIERNNIGLPVLLIKSTSFGLPVLLFKETIFGLPVLLKETILGFLCYEKKYWASCVITKRNNIGLPVLLLKGNNIGLPVLLQKKQF